MDHLKRAGWAGLTLTVAVWALPGLAQATFTDITADIGGLPGAKEFGASWADYDGDGDLDVYVAAADAGGTESLYRNDGTTFVDVTVPEGVDVDPAHTSVASWADYDNDGDLDLLLARRAGEPIKLFRREGDQFADVAAAVGLEATQAADASWGDYDNDGDVDLIVAQHVGFPNRLYRNDAGIFADVAPTYGFEALEWRQTKWVDYDLDHDMDLVVYSVADQEYQVYRNEAGSLTLAHHVPSSQHGSPEWGDYDNDGYPDLYIALTSGVPNHLYHNDSGAGFTDVAPAMGVAGSSNSYGPAWGDYDHDGDLDLFVGNGDAPASLYRNDGASFTDVAAAEGVATSPAVRRAAWADYDGDGDLDLYVVRGYSNEDKLFRNDLNPVDPLAQDDHWLQVDVTGTSDNAAAIGARVVAYTPDGVQRTRVVSGGGDSMGSQTAPRLHFGLGTSMSLDSLVVHWLTPYTLRQTLANVTTVDTLLPIVQSVPVTVPDTIATHQQPIQVPVSIATPPAGELVAAEIFVAYDSQVLATWSAPLSAVSATALTQDWTIESNHRPGVGSALDTLKVAMATDVHAVASAGDLLLLNFETADLRAPASSPLQLVHVLLNDGSIPADPVHGSVTLVGVDGSITSEPQSIIPRWPVTVTVTDADEDRAPAAVDTVSVRITNGAQTEHLRVDETAVASGEFAGSMQTVFSTGFTSGDGILQAQAGDDVVCCYTDSLDVLGATIERCDTTWVQGGADGAMLATAVAQAGDTVRVRVSDDDLIASVAVDAANPRTGELESLVLAAFAGGSTASMFGPLLTTAGTSGPGDGALSVARDDSVTTVYEDTLTALGGSADLVYATHVTFFGDADRNGRVGAYDAAMCLLYVLTGDPGMVDVWASNVDIDAPFDDIEPYDCSLILQRVVGRIDRFPVQTPCAANHPQPETCGSATPKPVAQPLAVELRPGDGYVSLWVDDRSAVLSGDLTVQGAADAGVAGELSEYLLLAGESDDGLRVVFAGAEPVSDAGELLRIYPGVGPTERVRLIRASFNGGQLVAAAPGGDLTAAAAPGSPQSFALLPNHPNPFNPETSIAIALPTAARVELAVFDALGRRVRTLLSGASPAGVHSVVWDGRDGAGTPVASGVYFCRLEAHAPPADGVAGDSFAGVRRMLLVK